jgi:hypothetical protein
VSLRFAYLAVLRVFGWLRRRRNRRDDLNNPRSNRLGRLFEAQLAGGVRRKDQLNGTLASFPDGTHDDQVVDTLSYAAKIVTGEWTPRRTEPRRGLDPHERAVTLAASSAIGGNDFDPMQLPYLL